MKTLMFILLLASTTLFAQTTDTAASFLDKELIEELTASKKAYLPFFDNEAMSMGIYQLEAGSVDGQSPHTYDEAYYVLEGKGKIKVENETHVAEKGSILFVKANATHQFIDIEKDLKLLVFFSKKLVDE